MPRRLLSLTLAAAVLLMMTGCGPSQLEKVAAEIATATGASADDIIRSAKSEAAVGNRTADDVARDWLAGVKGEAPEAAARSAVVSPELRSATCAAVTNVLADALDGDTTTDPSPLLAVLGAVGGQNRTVANQALLSDVQAAVTDLQAGRPATLELFLLKAGACELVAPS